jgi:hypothetical protein
VSTVLGRNVYSFVDGPKPDPSRMAADEKIEKAVQKAEAGGPDKSAKEYADDAKAYADGKGLKSDSKTAYLLPLTGHSGWTILFELEGDTVKYMSMGGPN